ncbi:MULTISPECIES: enoyl-CoA hydratase/isomerase family protein [Streptomyces]|uniref:enoyl-CoA hydratase/isomerase family protein n=1 Tax=Streptomyces TaxID=1883 RepID=UPI000BB0F213|nr:MULTISPECIES: enoyl-CoA hydratase/isomerase family protein [Streptomyces]MCX4430698.1 enoyl-CoA hydratase/isomerase family protein [Streptomyces mirabilis]PBD01996.1 enoyl-CoA hydratase/enoyl-CoA hydratase/2-(1,2-epoxy-1,2-dihydrophenyl)acetyl-CoA isomerase [Streptomyces sp. Ag82_O1-15]
MNAVADETPLCLSETGGGVATVTLNRPDARNAMNIPLLQQLVAALKGAREQDVGVLLLKAEGPSFCAGADVRSDDGTAMGRPGLRRRLIEEACDLVEAFPASVAAVQGPAVGGGWALAAAAVVTLAAPGAMFRFPELRLGFLPPDQTVRRLRAAVGPAAAFRLLVADERFTGDDLARLGLVDVVEAADLGHRARHLAEQFAAAPSDLVQTLRTALTT